MPAPDAELCGSTVHGAVLWWVHNAARPKPDAILVVSDANPRERFQPNEWTWQLLARKIATLRRDTFEDCLANRHAPFAANPPPSAPCAIEFVTDDELRMAFDPNRHPAGAIKFLRTGVSKNGRQALVHHDHLGTWARRSKHFNYLERVGETWTVVAAQVYPYPS